MSDAIDAVGGGEMCIISSLVQGSIYIQLDAPSLPALPADGFQLIVCREVTAAYSGSIQQIEENGRVFIRIILPLDKIEAIEGNL
jgi:hypothetical protein